MNDANNDYNKASEEALETAINEALEGRETEGEITVDAALKIGADEGKITTHETFESVLVAAAYLVGRIDLVKSIAKVTMAGMKAAASANISRFTGAVDKQMRALSTFAQEHREELLGGKQSAKRIGLEFGFRKSATLESGLHSDLTKAERDKMEVAMVKARFPDAIRIKEEVNLDVLKDLTDEQLQSIGFQRVKTETFYVKPL